MGDIKNILVINSNKLALEFLHNEFASIGFSTSGAMSLKEGLKLATGGNVDMILLDDAMTGMRPNEFVSILKGAANSKNIPVAVVTDDTDETSRKEGFDAGVSDYLMKPLSGEGLKTFMDKKMQLDAQIIQEDVTRILVVEDSPIVCRVYDEIFTRLGFEFMLIEDPKKAIEGLAEFLPDIILMDQNMPDINGFELTQMIKSENIFSKIPIIMVTSDTKKQSVIKALEYGVVDFLTKPFDEEVLLARIKAHVNNKKLYDKLADAYAEMKVLKDQLELLSITDGLTKLYNHRHFHTLLNDEMAKSKKNQNPLSLIIFDIDFFKKFNDTYGHKAGDMVIKTIARVAESSTNPSDICARYGGEEYAVILPGLESKVAMKVAERIRSNVEKTLVEFEGVKLAVTISLGVAQWDQEMVDDKFIVCADTAMYVSKDGGRNMASLYSQP